MFCLLLLLLLVFWLWRLITRQRFQLDLRSLCRTVITGHTLGVDWYCRRAGLRTESVRNRVLLPVDFGSRRRGYYQRDGTTSHLAFIHCPCPYALSKISQSPEPSVYILTCCSSCITIGFSAPGADVMKCAPSFLKGAGFESKMLCGGINNAWTCWQTQPKYHNCYDRLLSAHSSNFITEYSRFVFDGRKILLVRLFCAPCLLRPGATAPLPPPW